MKLFMTLTSYMGKESKGAQKVIDQNLFVESLGFASQEIEYANKNLTKEEKVIIFVERLN